MTIRHPQRSHRLVVMGPAMYVIPIAKEPIHAVEIYIETIKELVIALEQLEHDLYKMLLLNWQTDPRWKGLF